jgi:MarR family 2-MHQ and catechol resistance regulon transcriptional repressor
MFNMEATMGSHYNGTEEEIRALNTYLKLMRAAESVNSRLNPILTEAGLTISQFGVLEALYHLGPLCQSELSKKILKSNGNITMVIDNLEKQELVKRKRDAEDRRLVTVHLTEKGSNLVREVLPRQVAAIVKEMSILTKFEQEGLGMLCRKLGLKEKE